MIAIDNRNGTVRIEKHGKLSGGCVAGIIPSEVCLSVRAKRITFVNYATAEIQKEK